MMKRLLIVSLLCILPSLAWGQKTIDQLNSGSALTGTESVPVFQGSNPAVKTATQNIANLASISVGCSAAATAANPPLTISVQKAITPLSAANAPILASYCGGVENLSQATNDAPTIAVAGSAGFTQGWFTDLCNISANTKTITPASGTIGGAATYVIAAASAAAPKCITIVSDAANTNYAVETSGSGASPGGTSGQLQTNNGSGGFAGAAGVTAAQMPALTGDCATTAGTVATTCNALPHPGYIVNNWYVPIGVVQVATGQSLTANKITCHYGAAAQNITIDNVGVLISGAAASGNLQVALYTNASGRPATLITSTASISTAGAVPVNAALAANAVVGPSTANGRDLWWCNNVDTNGAAALMQSLNAAVNASYTAAIIGSSAQANAISAAATNVGISCTGAACTGGSSTFNTWPASLVGSTWTEITSARVTAIEFRVKSLP